MPGALAACWFAWSSRHEVNGSGFVLPRFGEPDRAVYPLLYPGFSGVRGFSEILLVFCGLRDTQIGVQVLRHHVLVRLRWRFG